MEITKREILASFTIIAIMLIFGFLISDKIVDSELESNEKYDRALRIEDQDMFRHGMDTDVGFAFVKGKWNAVDTVSFPEIEGEYSYIKKVKEKYTRHTRTVTKTKTVNGKKKTYTETEVYWTWDEVDSWKLSCTKITFLGEKFDYQKIPVRPTTKINTIKETSKIRYVYYATPATFEGTIFADLRNDTIPDNTEFYNGKDIDQLYDYLYKRGGVVIFWIFWIILIAGLVFAFYYAENNWLEDKIKKGDK